MLLVAAFLFGGRSATAQDKCSNLAALRLPDVRIVEAAVVEPGEQGDTDDADSFACAAP